MNMTFQTLRADSNLRNNVKTTKNPKQAGGGVRGGAFGASTLIFDTITVKFFDFSKIVI